MSILLATYIKQEIFRNLQEGWWPWIVSFSTPSERQLLNIGYIDWYTIHTSCMPSKIDQLSQLVFWYGYSSAQEGSIGFRPTNQDRNLNASVTRLYKLLSAYWYSCYDHIYIHHFFIWHFGNVLTKSHNGAWSQIYDHYVEIKYASCKFLIISLLYIRSCFIFQAL